MLFRENREKQRCTTWVRVQTNSSNCRPSQNCVPLRPYYPANAGIVERKINLRTRCVVEPSARPCVCISRTTQTCISYVSIRELLRASGVCFEGRSPVARMVMGERSSQNFSRRDLKYPSSSTKIVRRSAGRKDPSPSLLHISLQRCWQQGRRRSLIAAWMTPPVAQGSSVVPFFGNAATGVLITQQFECHKP